MANKTNLTVPGHQPIYPAGLSIDILFSTSRGRRRLLWVLAHPPESREAGVQVSVSDCPRVLFSLAVAFLSLYFQAILLPANIWRAKIWYRKLKSALTPLRG